MTVAISRSAFVATKAGQSIPLSQMVSITPGGTNPPYLVLSGLDRNEYTVAGTGATGTLTGGGVTGVFGGAGGDFRSVGLVFTYNAATGQYVNSTYGSLTNLIYKTSGSVNDQVNFALYGFSNQSLATSYASSPAALMQLANLGYASYLGSASVATQPTFSGSVPSQATPDSIVSTAESFVGRAWNENGCWVLASDIATQAGAALPVTSTEVGVPARSSGEWFVAYDGPVASNANWESQVHAGEVVSFQTGAGGGHIVTVVSGSGSTAEVVDNITYVNSKGQVVNAAGDGSASDVTISAPHLFSQELSGVPANSVAVYELDTPVVTADSATATLACRATVSLGSLFTAADPKGTAITEYQVYESNSADKLIASGTTTAPTSASPLTASSLSGILLQAGSSSNTDTLDIRAYNGSYWGDWTTETIGVTSQSAPVVAHQTASQSWTAGQAVSLSLGNVFTDPQGQSLHLAVTQSNGSALPAGLTFNATTDMLTGTAPITPQTLGLQVTATDTGGLSTTEVFQASIAAPSGPKLALQTGTQTWAPGSNATFTLPAGTFSAPAGQHLSYAAYQNSGPDATSWLHFNNTTDTLYGTVPTTATGSIGVAVVAFNGTQTATDSFAIQFGGGTTAHPATAGSTVEAATVLHA